MLIFVNFILSSNTYEKEKRYQKPWMRSSNWYGLLNIWSAIIGRMISDLGELFRKCEQIGSCEFLFVRRRPKVLKNKWPNSELNCGGFMVSIEKPSEMRNELFFSSLCLFTLNESHCCSAQIDCYWLKFDWRIL